MKQADLFGGGKEKKKSDFESYNGDDVDYKMVSTKKELSDMCHELAQAKKLAFDTETSSLNPITTTLVGVSFSTRAGNGWYIPTNSRGLSHSQIVSAIKPILESPDSLKIAHNFKFDYKVLHFTGDIKVNGPVFDTGVAAYLINNSQKIKMDEVSKKYLNYEPISITNFLQKGRTMLDIPPSEVSTYACEDTDVTYRLYEKLRPILIEDGLAKLAGEIEFPSIYALCEMEINGIEIDMGFINEFSKELTKRLYKAERDMYEKVGYKFNPNSPNQVGQALYEDLNFPVIERTKTGNKATGADVLKKLAKMRGDDSFPDLILKYRQHEKLRSTYVDALPKKIEPSTGRIHTSFNNVFTDTGRLSSSNPNLQNIPNRWDFGRQVRRAFVASDGYLLLNADYSQMELRIIAAISQDPVMLEVFNSGGDIHQRLADEIGESRDVAKTVNYAIPYGAGGPKIAATLGKSTRYGNRLIEKVFDRFKGMKWYIDHMKDFAKKHGYVQTIYGRRRYLPKIKSKNKWKRLHAERQAVNMPIQGASADIMKKAMIDVHNWIHLNDVDCNMLLQVHDELVMEVPEDDYSTIQKQVEHLMRTAADIGVDLTVDSGVAKDWSEGH